MNSPDYLPEVRDQYEEYPYPERNPQDEKTRLNGVTIDCLDRINHYCHKGCKDFSKASRILVAGGGTGDSTIYFAEQLRDSGSEVVYLDFSKVSQDIAKKRAKARGLNNIKWIQDSILNLPNLDIGEFDHISCTGVLHHLENPSQGLDALNSVLKDDGAMSLMLYAKYGRTAIYHIQELMQIVNINTPDMQDKINDCRMTLGSLQDDHWFNLANHIARVSDIELYDLYMHAQDRCYTVPQLYDYVETSALNIVHLFDDYGTNGNSLYDPGHYIKDVRLLETVRKLDIRQQQAIGEIMNGRILMHSFYVSNHIGKQANLDMLNHIPSLSMTAEREGYDALYHLCNSVTDYVPIKISSTNVSLGFKKTQNMELFFKYLNGTRTMTEIYDEIILAQKNKGLTLSYDNLNHEFQEMFGAMSTHNMLLVRDSSVPIYKTISELHAQM